MKILGVVLTIIIMISLLTFVGTIDILRPMEEVKLLSNGEKLWFVTHNVCGLMIILVWCGITADSFQKWFNSNIK